MYTTDELTALMGKLPRVRLAHLPTPLEYLPRLSDEIGGPRIWIKRDDCTGLAMGGNKTRHCELILADALNSECDTVVWGAGLQSNNCRQTAAACAKVGLACHLVLGRGKPANGPDELQGNLLLDHLVGASIEIVDEHEGPELDARIAQSVERLRADGRKVYAREPKRVKPLAALSYVTTVVELHEQFKRHGISPRAVFTCSAGSTGAGIALAVKALGETYHVRYVTPIVWPWDTQQNMTDIANSAAEMLGISTRLIATDIDVTEAYVGEGYAIPTPGCLEAIRLLARTEGILVDSSYTGKSLSGLIDAIRNKEFSTDDDVVFLHTGGTPAIFAHSDELASGIPAAPQL